MGEPAEQGKPEDKPEHPHGGPSGQQPHPEHPITEPPDEDDVPEPEPKA